MYFPDLFCMFMIGLVLGVIAHEAGHWAVGRLLGFEIALVTIGNGPVWHRTRIGETTIELRRYPTSGSVRHLLVPRKNRLSSILFGLGGVGGNIALLGLIALLTSGPSTPFVEAVAPGIVAAQVMQIGYNLFPRRLRDGAESDGYQILRILFGVQRSAASAAERFAAWTGPYRTASDPPFVPSLSIMRASERFASATDRATAARDLLRALDRGKPMRSETLVVLDQLITRQLLRGDAGLSARLDELSSRAFDIAPGLATLRGTRGASLVELGRYAEGKVLLAPLVEAQPSFDTTLSQLFLARAEHALGATGEAHRLVEAARATLAASPHSEARGLLERVEDEIEDSSAKTR